MLKNPFSRREEEQRIKGENRLPPGQSLTQKFPVLHYGPIPQTDLSTWDFKVFGEVEEEVTWNWEEFNQLPKTAVTMDIHCVTRWSKFDTLWEGVSVKTLVDEGFISPGDLNLFQYAETAHEAWDLIVRRHGASPEP